MHPERRYSEKEMRAIFARAARRRPVDDAAGAGGLTLAELQEVGAAAGFDPVDVAEAAAELRAGPPARARVLGLTREVTRTRLLPGPVSDEGWGTLVADLRRTFRTTGVVADVGRVREWASSLSENDLPVRASLEPEGDGVRLTLTHRPGDLVAVLTAIGAVTLGVLGLVMSFDTGIRGIGLAILALVVAAYFGVRFAYERSLRRTAQRFEATLDRAAARAGSAGPQAATLAPPGATPRLDLDALEAPDPAAISAGATRLRG